MSGNDLSSLLFLLLPLLLLGWLVLSQRRRVRTLQDVQSSIQVGDEVRTTSGLFGRVSEADDTVLHLEVAPGVVVRFDRRAVDTKVAPSAAPLDPGPDTASTSDTAATSDAVPETDR